jgi:multidrug resistance efflux pump
VKQVEEALANARFELEETVTRAPADGFVTAMALTVGTYVRVQPVLSFVDTEESIVVALISQSTAKYVGAGNGVEVAFGKYPGHIFTGQVITAIRASGEAQLTASGKLPDAGQIRAANHVYVVLQLDEYDTSAYDLHIGLGGQGAIYTDFAKPVHIIRKIMVRIGSLKDYVL